MRLKAEIWIKAYLRRCASEGAAGYVVRRGDADAGSIFIRVNRLDGSSLLFGPAPAGMKPNADGRAFTFRTSAEGEGDMAVNERLDKEVSFDSDIWIIEIESREGRHFLDDWLAS